MVHFALIGFLVTLPHGGLKDLLQSRDAATIQVVGRFSTLIGGFRP
jgi:hypothetical protein